MSENCDHENVRPYGNPDPHGGRTRGRVATKFSVDAECTDCGDKLTVEYSFDGIRGEPK